MNSPSPTRAYRVHALDEAASHAHSIDGASFEDAALSFIEDWHPAPDDDGDVTVIVRDQETGREQCFRIDLDTGETAPCQ